MLLIFLTVPAYGYYLEVRCDSKSSTICRDSQIKLLINQLNKTYRHALKEKKMNQKALTKDQTGWLENWNKEDNEIKLNISMRWSFCSKRESF